MAKLQVHNYAKLPNHYVTIERSKGLTVLEEKLVYMLINAMQKRYESTKKLAVIDYDYIASSTLTIDEFCKTMNIGAKDNNLLRKGLFSLFEFSLAVHEDLTTRFIHLFDEFTIMKADSGLVLKYAFHRHFLEYFTGVCKHYFSLEVQEVVGLKSSYAIRIYQILKSKLNMDKKEHEYALIELKKHLNIGNKYSLYGDFKKSVLEIAKKHINQSEASKFSIDYKEIKEGRAVVSIKFIIQNKNKNYYVENNLVAGYKINQIKQKLKIWLNHENSIVRILAEKIENETKEKKPSRALIENYTDTILQIVDSQNNI